MAGGKRCFGELFHQWGVVTIFGEPTHQWMGYNSMGDRCWLLIGFGELAHH